MAIFEVIVLWNWIVFQFKQIFPYWIAGVFIGSVLSVFAAEKISGRVGKISSGRYGLVVPFFAAVLGAASPICMYGTVPLAASLGKKGVPQYVLATFMVSSILINPNLFVFSFVLGAPVALGRLFFSIAAGIVAGLLVKLFFKQENLFNFEGFQEKKKCAQGENKIKVFLNDLNRGIIKTAPYFLVGIVLAALFERYIPKSLITGLFGSNKGLGVLFATLFGIPIYVCGGGTVPLIKAWMEAGMSSGSAMAFMMIGPATKLTNLTAVKIILGIRNFVLYIAFNVVFAIAAGFLTDALWGIWR